MKRYLTIRNVAIAVSLTLVWCGLWGSFSVANALSGLLVSTAILASGVGGNTDSGLRVVPLARLFVLVLVDLIRSTIAMAVEILTPTDYTKEGIVAVNLPADHRQHLLFLTVAITLTPGTAVVDVDRENGTLYLHLLHIEQSDATIAHVHELARVADEAWPTRSIGVAS